MWNKTPFTELLKIRYPIVQGPFGGGLSSVKLASTISNLGGMGSFGAQPLTPEQILETTHAIKQLTDRPFAINLWVNDRDSSLLSYSEKEYQELITIFKPYFDEFDVTPPEMPTDLGPKYEDQVLAMLDAKPPVFSFVFGIPSGKIIEACRRNGTKTIGTATTSDEAMALEKAGIDAVVATGFEAGGHRVSFLAPAEDSLTGTFSLIPQVSDSVSIPVIAAGGVSDVRGIKAALALGADAVQMGTAFLATEQSNATPAHRSQLFSNASKYTTLTKIFSGRLARGIRSKLTIELKDKEHLMAPYPMQSKFLNTLRSKAISANHDEYITFWSGQSAPLIRFHDASQLFHHLVAEMNANTTS